MFRVSLITDRNTHTYLWGHMQFALMAVESPHLRSRFLRDAIYERDMKVILETRPLARAHATAVYTRLLPVLVTALPSNAYTDEQFAAMPVLPPQKDYFVRTEIAPASHANTHIATVMMLPMRGGLNQERDLPARDARMISRTVRAAVCEEIQQVELLWNADKTLAEIFRRQCGLGQSESQGWLFDFSIDFI